MRLLTNAVFVWAAILFGAGLANAGDVCGRVRVLGHDLPNGFVTLDADLRAWQGSDSFGGGLPHAGTTERSMVRIDNGRF